VDDTEVILVDAGTVVDARLVVVDGGVVLADTGAIMVDVQVVVIDVMIGVVNVCGWCSLLKCPVSCEI